jgi:amidase
MTLMRDAPADLWRMSATELAQAIRSKQVSSREAIEAHLRRIEAVDPDVNAVPVVLGEQPLEAADAADRAPTARWRAGRPT